MDLAAQLGEIALALVLTIGVLLACAWLVKRTQSGGLSRPSGLRVIANLSLGGKERLCVVEVGQTQLLLGVSPGSVAVLTELPEPIAASASGVDSFAAVLKGVTGRG